MTRSRSGDPDPDDAADRDDRSSRTWPWVVAPAVLVGVAVVAGVFVVGFGTTTGCACSPTVPLVEFEYDHGNGTVVVVHEGGKRITEENTGKLAVHVNGEQRRSIALPFIAGNTATVEGVEPGDEIRLVWTRPDGDRTRTMAQYTVPDE